MPRGRGSNNPIKVIRFEASEDGTNWESIGQFGFTNQDAALKYYVKSSTARYIKLVIPDGVGNGTVAAIRELDVRVQSSTDINKLIMRVNSCKFNY